MVVDRAYDVSRGTGTKKEALGVGSLSATYPSTLCSTSSLESARVRTSENRRELEEEDEPHMEIMATPPSSNPQDLKDLPPNRFELELEFLQCLSSPAYLHHLATTGTFNDPQFLDFLKYLQYWRRPEYVRYIIYPNSLYFLDLLISNERFRKELANVPFRNFIHEQQFYSWQHRSSHLYGKGLQEKKEK